MLKQILKYSKCYSTVQTTEIIKSGHIAMTLQVSQLYIFILRLAESGSTLYD